MRWGVVKVIVGVVGVLGLPGSAGAGKLTLTWTDNATNELGFTIQRKAEACAGTAAWADLASVAANVTTYADLTVAEGSTYCYRLNAWNTVDGTPTGTKQYSAWSNSAGAAVPFSVPAVPSQLGVTYAP